MREQCHDPLKDPVFALHRYFIWANDMRRLFDAELAKVPAGTNVANSWASEQFIHFFMYMCLWYGVLRALVEGWIELKLSDSEIDGLLAMETGRMNKVQLKGGGEEEVPETYSDLLRKVRNAVFHYQPEYFDQRLIDFMTDKQSAAWVRRLNSAFGRWFLNWLDTRKAQK